MTMRKANNVFDIKDFHNLSAIHQQVLLELLKAFTSYGFTMSFPNKFIGYGFYGHIHTPLGVMYVQSGSYKTLIDVSYSYYTDQEKLTKSITLFEDNYLPSKTLILTTLKTMLQIC